MVCSLNVLSDSRVYLLLHRRSGFVTSAVTLKLRDVTPIDKRKANRILACTNMLMWREVFLEPGSRAGNQIALCKMAVGNEAEEGRYTFLWDGWVSLCVGNLFKRST